MSRTITQREFRNQSAAVMDAVESGETIVVTRNGTPVAVIKPVERKPTSINSDELRKIFALSPDPDYAQFRADVDEFFGDDDRIRDEDYA
jgi:prevent-host-death family protein